MKRISTLIIFFTTICVITSAQQFQVVNQHSDGGTPWSFKNSVYEEEISTERMPAFDVEQMIAEDLINENDKSRPYRFGYNHYVSFNPGNAGTWRVLENGDRIWRLGIESPGALSINLAFQYVSLPEGAKFFVFSADHSILLGGFSQKYISPDYEFGTELIDGDKVIIELYEPAAVAGQSSLELYRVTHRYRGVDGFLSRAFGQSGSCMNNVRCPSYSAYDNQIRSVVCLVSGGSEFCTGALINNTCNDGTPYVLTANHCGSSGFGSWVFRFNWEASGCSNPGSSPSSVSMSGGTQRAAYSGADMSLVQINNPVPSNYNVYFSGWDRQNNVTANAYGIHHPSGDIKKISFTSGNTVSTTYAGAATWRTGTWVDGVTEPGSSGSPLFNSSGQIIGQLYGGPATCQYENNSTNGVDYYGKLFTSWTGGGSNSTRLSNWLAPASCGAAPNTLPGYDPNAATIAWDANIQSIISPTGTLCDGNISPVIVLRNNGINTITSATINYQVDGGSATPYVWNGSLATGVSTNVTMPAISVAAGAHSYTVTVSNPNGNPDGNAANNTQTTNFTISNPVGVTLPFTEGFQSATFPPTNWINENPDNNVGSALWVRTTSAGGFGNTNASARIDQYSPGSSTAGQVDNLITPYLDFTTASAPINLTFSVANARYNASLYDSLIVWVTTNCGGTWIRQASYGNNSGPNALATAPDNTNSFTPTSGQWATKTVNLSAYASQPVVRVRFQLKSGWGNNTYIDDINISGAGSGVDPTASFTMSSPWVCAGGSISFTNTSINATTYQWQFPFGTPFSTTTVHPTVTYNTPGTYTVTLTAINSNGTNSTTATVTVVNCSGVDEQDFEQMITVYPNPASDVITLVNPMGKDGFTVELISPLGEILAARNLPGEGPVTFDISGLAAGTYLLRVKQDGNQAVKRFMVVR